MDEEIRDSSPEPEEQIYSSLFCWGSTASGELGFGAIEEDFVSVPRCLDSFKQVHHVQDLSCGRHHTLLLLQNGNLYSCGNNDYGQLGHSRSRYRFELISALSAHIIRWVSSGESHSVAVNSAGQAFSWGNNTNGQLGLDSSEPTVTTPRLIKKLVHYQIVQVACGYQHTMALTESGQLFSWGNNSQGQLGLGSSKGPHLSVPTAVGSLEGVPIAQIAAGGSHSLALTKSGAIFAWGKNLFGQLGLNCTENCYYPCLLRSLRSQKICYICCGEDHTVALTKEGGVFTFGAGMYGQLGHGSRSNEILPRQVLELMGSTVTQIATGRCHTLAYAPSRGRVYSFGLGGNGQLGIGTTDNRTSPFVASGPWVHHTKGATLSAAARCVSRTLSRNSSFTDNAPTAEPPDVDMAELDIEHDPDIEEGSSDESEEDTSYVVHKIISGGNQSFVIATQEKNLVQPQDFRRVLQDNQILHIERKKMEELKDTATNEPVPMDLMSYVETVFSSPSCLNGSFLLKGLAHYHCSSRNSGVDLNEAEYNFNCIQSSKNTRIPELVLNCLQDLMLQIPSPPPDVESLRLFLSLPLAHYFQQTQDHMTNLILPLAACLLSLPLAASKVIEMWWAKTDITYFRNLVQIYKSCISVILRTFNSIKPTDRIKFLTHSLDLLQKLNKVNIEKNEMVPYQEFYIHEISEMVNIQQEYYYWLHGKSPKLGVSFCNYPFVFDAQAKTIILQIDSGIQMERAFTNAYLSSLFLQDVPYLILRVSRNSLLFDTINQLCTQSSQDLKKPLKVVFNGEEAIDDGGPRKEFFLLLLKEVLNPKFGMFKEYEETHNIWFNPQTFEEPQMFNLIGIVCGLAIYNFIIIELPFPLVLYKKLLKEKIKLEDLKGLSPTLVRSLHNILQYDGDDFEETFSLNFEVMVDVYGEMVNFELKPNGKNIPVSKENRSEYVDLYYSFILNESITEPYKAFANGFHQVCGGRVLDIFHAQELMDLVIGNEDYNWEELENSTEYKDQYNEHHPVIKRFWEVFHSLSLPEKKKFLLFLTGSDRIPILGMKSVQLIIQPVMTDDNHLPSAHTCYSILDLPPYSSTKILRTKLLQAIEHTHGFALV